MLYNKIKKELTDFYVTELPRLAQRTREAVFGRMDAYAEMNPSDSSYKMKAKLYEAIADEIEPVVFEDIPIFFETGALTAFSDGKFNRGGFIHANGWLYLRNEHLFRDVDPEAYELFRKNGAAALYAQTGSYVDIMHFGIPMKKVFGIGLSGIRSELEAELGKCDNEEEKDFLLSALAGIDALSKIADKFSAAAREKGMTELAEVAGRVPWNAPTSTYEGLCTLAFMRKALGAIEGVGFNSFGRVDVLLSPLYESDKAKGVDDEALLDLITKFLLIWDCTRDRRAPMSMGYEYELENSLTLGGCDASGNEVFNGITRLFITARNNHNIIYPKFMLRYSERSSDEYLRLITSPLLKSQSFSLFASDDSIIPALRSSGIRNEDAIDYTIGGCWDPLTQDEANKFSGEYVNIIRPLEWLVNHKYDEIKKNELPLLSLDECESFDELYGKYIESIKALLMLKAKPMSVGSREWHKVNPLPALSALMNPCIPKRTDVTAGGGRYNRECACFCGFAEAIDSLLAIKSLCFDKKLCTPPELFRQCRENWPSEALRQRAISAPSYGDGSEESSRLAGRLFDDLYTISRGLPTAYGGEYRIGYHLYTEVVRWGEMTDATPNGRRRGDYLSQGISPSRLVRDATAFDLLDTFGYLDTKKCASNSSVTVSLPLGTLSEDKLVSFMRAVSRSGIQSLQLNCVDRDTLIKAQENPEAYGNLIVRVCGFSAPFVLLSKKYQDEIISRSSM